jgi:hypothetical protein
MCGLRDVLEVFGGLRPSVVGLGRSRRAGICDLRDVLDVFLQDPDVFGCVFLYKPECGVCATFRRYFL